MKNIKKWIIGVLIISIIFGVGLIAAINKYDLKSNTIINANIDDTISCMSNNIVIRKDDYKNKSKEYTMNIVYTTDWVKIRDNPSFDSSIVAIVSPDTGIMRIEKYDNGWSKVIHEEEPKYVYSDYLAEKRI